MKAGTARLLRCYQEYEDTKPKRCSGDDHAADGQQHPNSRLMVSSARRAISVLYSTHIVFMLFS